jgi:hypothetical protein
VQLKCWRSNKKLPMYVVSLSRIFIDLPPAQSHVSWINRTLLIIFAINQFRFVIFHTLCTDSGPQFQHTVFDCKIMWLQNATHHKAPAHFSQTHKAYIFSNMLQVLMVMCHNDASNTLHVKESIQPSSLRTIPSIQPSPHSH